MTYERQQGSALREDGGGIGIKSVAAPEPLARAVSQRPPFLEEITGTHQRERLRRLIAVADHARTGDDDRSHLVCQLDTAGHPAVCSSATLPDFPPTDADDMLLTVLPVAVCDIAVPHSATRLKEHNSAGARDHDYLPPIQHHCMLVVEPAVTALRLPFATSNLPYISRELPRQRHVMNSTFLTP